MMYCLGRIGGPMGKALTYAYSRFGCRWCRVRRKKSEMTVQRLTESENNNDDIVTMNDSFENLFIGYLHAMYFYL